MLGGLGKLPPTCLLRLLVWQSLVVLGQKGTYGVELMGISEITEVGSLASM